MYAFISGKLSNLTPTSVIIENQGFGYQLQISLHTYTAIKELKEATLFTHVVLRTENQASAFFMIYGFADEAERSLFLELVSVSGVGNNTAQLILSSFEPGSLIQEIGSGNVAALQKVKGIGSKTAQRIIIDLKDKMLKSGTGNVKIPSLSGNTSHGEALSALLTLGFSRPASEKAINKAQKSTESNVSVEDLIKAALANL